MRLHIKSTKHWIGGKRVITCKQRKQWLFNSYLVTGNCHGLYDQCTHNTHNQNNKDILCCIKCLNVFKPLPHNGYVIILVKFNIHVHTPNNTDLVQSSTLIFLWPLAHSFQQNHDRYFEVYAYWGAQVNRTYNSNDIMLYLDNIVFWMTTLPRQLLHFL